MAGVIQTRFPGGLILGPLTIVYRGQYLTTGYGQIFKFFPLRGQGTYQNLPYLMAQVGLSGPAPQWLPGTFILEAPHGGGLTPSHGEGLGPVN